MAAKKTTTKLGPKAQLMKKSVDQLKRKAKQLKIQGYSTKKKEQLVNSIMMAEARAKRKPGTKRKKAAPKAAAVKSVTTRVTMKGSGMKRKPIARNASRRPSKPMMGSYNGWYNYETWLTNMWYESWFQDISEQYGTDVYELAEAMKDAVENDVYETTGGQGFVSDAINGFINEVNWREIAEHYID